MRGKATLRAGGSQTPVRAALISGRGAVLSSAESRLLFPDQHHTRHPTPRVSNGIPGTAPEPDNSVLRDASTSNHHPRPRMDEGRAVTRVTEAISRVLSPGLSGQLVENLLAVTTERCDHTTDPDSRTPRLTYVRTHV